jgi:hypothetical protein
MHPVTQSYAALFLLLREIPPLPWNTIVLLGSGVPMAIAYTFFLSLGQMPLEVRLRCEGMEAVEAHEAQRHRGQV